MLQLVHQKPGGRVFVTGDLHGAFPALREALNAVSFDVSKDQLVAVGDLIDRGPMSYPLLRLVRDTDWFHSVRGNHEQMVIDEEFTMHAANGGEWFFKLPLDEQYKVRAICEDLPVAIEIHMLSGKRVGVIHAEVPGSDWAYVKGRCNLMEALWSRTQITRLKDGHTPPKVQGIDVVYFGHTPLSAPTRSGNRVWIDTGAWYNEKVYLEELR